VIAAPGNGHLFVKGRFLSLRWAAFVLACGREHLVTAGYAVSAALSGPGEAPGAGAVF